MLFPDPKDTVESFPVPTVRVDPFHPIIFYCTSASAADDTRACVKTTIALHPFP
jgi:hypothetical protein